MKNRGNAPFIQRNAWMLIVLSLFLPVAFSKGYVVNALTLLFCFITCLSTLLFICYLKVPTNFTGLSHTANYQLLYKTNGQHHIDNLLLPGTTYSRYSNISGKPATFSNMQLAIKRAIDIILSLIGLIILSPLLIYTALRVKHSSKGPLLYKQQRLGCNGIPFLIYKFRSMHVHAEINGPALSCDGDQRVTAWGGIMRKWRLDELPQLWNILIGEMTIVGPRPERAYYVNRILDHAPNYQRLLQLKPGLTSMGMVRFGYASSVTEMIERQRYDQFYFENKSLLLDAKILVATLHVIALGKGK